MICELTFAEIRALPMAAVLALANSRAQNPLGSVLVSHDKRFFQALSEPRFLQAALSPTEQGLLEKYLVPTYGYGANPAAWAAAQANKDGYILKHMAKGKSVDVHAGCLTDEKEWQALFDRPAIADFVLQPMVRQKKFTGSIGAEIRADHSAGTLLYFNDAYFGPGLYRTSSSPVSGLADFRKMAPLVAKTDHKVDGCLYID